MAVLSMFFGIIVSMYYHDNKKHHLPHVHVKYQGYEAVYAIEDGKLLDGEMKPAQEQLVKAWMIIHKDELWANWELASGGTNIFKIEPLR
jgi:hypothetical protein